MNRSYAIAKILDVRMEYEKHENKTVVLEAIDKILKKLDVEVLNQNREDE